mgnify:CR=1 FL=1
MQAPEEARTESRADRPGACVGPNAVIQLADALRDMHGTGAARQVFECAGFAELLDQPPTQMINERIPAALFTALWQNLPDESATRIAKAAGQRTADYILANRIPRAVQIILRRLPAPIAAPILLAAINKNAWTFVGSGTCRTSAGQPAVIEISDNPLAMPDCVWHQAVFERLFRELVSLATVVRHSMCCTRGDPLCHFELSFSGPKHSNRDFP